MWVKIDDGFADHPKVEPLSDRAFRLAVRAICYCGRFLTDGLIPRAVVAKMDDGDCAAELVAARLWEEPDADNFNVHDYLDYNPSRASVLARRASDKERQDRARGIAQDESRRESRRESRMVSRRDSARCHSVPSRPVPSPSYSQSQEDLPTDNSEQPDKGSAFDQTPEPSVGRSSWQATLGKISLERYGNDLAVITPQLDTALTGFLTQGFSREDIAQAWGWACDVARDRDHPQHKFIPRAPSVRQLVNKLDIWFEQAIAHELAAKNGGSTHE